MRFRLQQPALYLKILNDTEGRVVYFKPRENFGYSYWRDGRIGFHPYNKEICFGQENGRFKKITKEEAKILTPHIP